MTSHAIEETQYEITRQMGEVELRRYAPDVVAEVVIDASAQDAGSRAFPILSGYIVGKNKGEMKFAMSAAGISTQGAPVLARYNAPMTPP